MNLSTFFDGANSLILNIIILVLGVSSLISILDSIGMLPGKVRDWFKLNRAEDTLKVMEELGVDLKRLKKQNSALLFPKGFEYKTIERTTLSALNEYKIDKHVSVGNSRPTRLTYYYDLIGGTCNPKTAEYYAKILSTFWSEASLDSSIVRDPVFDFIVTPKGGSPILGYEFSKLCDKPFILHEEKARFNDNDDDMRKWFDCREVPEKGRTAIIIDDSITGGNKIIATVNHLRKYGYQVHTCFVVFEVCEKNGRKLLDNIDIELVNVVKTHKRTETP